MSMKTWFARESDKCRNFEAKTAHKSRPRLAGFAMVCVATVLSFPAWADLVTIPPINVRLIAPGGITGDSTQFTKSDILDYGNPINTFGSGEIGTFMLPGEQIALSTDNSNNSIRIRAAQGNDAGGTGYLGLGGLHARYELSGLGILGSTLTGITVYAFDDYATSPLGFSGVLSGVGVSLIDSDSNSSLDTLVFNLDDLLFKDRPGGNSLNFAEFRIDILSTLDQPPPPPPNDVPEPGTLVLAAVGLAAVRVVSRRSANAKAGH